MPKIAKTSTNNRTTGTKKAKSVLDDEVGIDKPYWDAQAPTFFRYKSKWYTKDKNGEIVRHYPPDEKRPRTEVKSKS